MTKQMFLWLAFLAALIFSGVGPSVAPATCATVSGSDDFCGTVPFTYCQYRCLNCGGVGCERCSCRLDVPDDQAVPAQVLHLKERTAVLLERLRQRAQVMVVEPYSSEVEGPHLDWAREENVPPPRSLA